jgi:hypothetical protein
MLELDEVLAPAINVATISSADDGKPRSASVSVFPVPTPDVEAKKCNSCQKKFGFSRKAVRHIFLLFFFYISNMCFSHL